MTDFSDAINWAINNVPMEDSDDYADWREQVLDNLQGGEKIKNNQNLNKGLENAWVDTFGSLDATPSGSVEKVEPVEFSREYIDNRPQFNSDGTAKVRPVEESPQLPLENERTIPRTGEAPTIPKPTYEIARPSGFTSSIRGIGSSIARGFKSLFRI